MEDIDKSVMELLVQKQPIGTWPIVGLRYSSTVQTVKEHGKAHEEHRSIHTNLGKTKNSVID